MSDRKTLSADRVAPAALANTTRLYPEIVAEVEAAITKHKVVVVGMAQNPVVKRARRLLDAKGTPFTYLEYGSYLSGWKKRLAIKLWAGFPTFPMVFVDGVLIGGATELDELQKAGKAP